MGACQRGRNVAWHCAARSADNTAGNSMNLSTSNAGAMPAPYIPTGYRLSPLLAQEQTIRFRPSPVVNGRSALRRNGVLTYIELR